MTGFVTALIRYVPNLVGMNLILLFFIDGVLKYRFKNRKRICIIVVVLSILFGLVISLNAVDPFPGEYRLEVAVATVDSAEDIDVNEEDFAAVTQALLSLILIVFITIEIRDKVLRKLAVAIFSTSILSEFTMLFSLLHSTVLGFFKNSEMNAFLFIGSMYLFMFLEFLLLYYIANLRTKYDNTPMPIRILFVAFVFFGLFVSVFTGLLSGESNTNIRRVITIISLLMVLAGTLIFFYIRAARKERSKLLDVNSANEQLITAQTEYFEASARADKEIRAIRHDMKNNIQVLSLLLENNEYDKMRDYLDELGENLQSTDVSAHTGNTIADAIIAEKKQKASALGLALNASGQIKGVEISSVDMCKMLANILDNAIEAASAPSLSELSSDIKTITLDFRSTGNFFMMIATNPCVTCPEIKDGQIKTTKKEKENHGFGIKNISSAAANYGGEVSLNCEPAPYGGTFTIEVMIPIN
ncbi:MAG: GHKL domain-containing protein [Clostridiales bacterium]|nr:GHKL domain-containing protein [Clostridiales bacterium]